MAAVVSHGRRKGTPRESNTNQLKDNKVVILSASDMERLKFQLSGLNPQKEEAKERQEQKEAKHQLSLSKVKNWENTIEGQRLKRLEKMKQKQEKEEEERLKIDEEEAKFQAQCRKEAIDRAKTLLYYQTDRLKGFHSALVLSEVLKEREAQIALRKKRNEKFKNQDDTFARYQEEIREQSLKAEMLTAQERITAANELFSYQKKQASECEAARKKERELLLQEQTAIEKDAQMWQEKEKQKTVAKDKKNANHRKELDDLLATNKIAAANLQEKEKRDELERQAFAQAKMNMMKMRNAKEMEIIKEFQHHQDKIATHVHGIIKEKVSNEDERIAKAVAEENAKREAIEREKAEKHMREMKEIDIHCRNMIMEQERKKRETKESDQELLQQRIAQDLKFHSNQIEKYKQSFSKAKDLQKFHKAQMVEKAEREKGEKQDENGYHEQNLDLLNVEESQFQEYAENLMKEAKSRGATLYPLEKASKRGFGGGHGPVFSAKGGVRPSYLPCASPIVELPTYTSKELPLPWRMVNTKKRMGFIW